MAKMKRKFFGAASKDRTLAEVKQDQTREEYLAYMNSVELYRCRMCGKEIYREPRVVRRDPTSGRLYRDVPLPGSIIAHWLHECGNGEHGVVELIGLRSNTLI